MTAQRAVQPSPHALSTHRRAVHVERSHLNESLDRFARSEATRAMLLSAPAGFGKTTLVADWVARLLPGDLVAGWCSVGALDSTCFRFWSSVLAALDLDPHSDAQPISAPRQPGSEEFLLRLAAAAAAAGPRVLVIDDLHELTDPGTLGDLDWLIAHLPGPLRLVLITRSDPPLAELQRVRLSGGLAQLRARDLALRQEEVGAVCEELPDDVATQIWGRTAGWPAMVQLMRLAAAAGDLGGFDLRADDAALAQYLFEETVCRQRPQTQRVLQLCSLPDSLPLALAVRLTGQRDVGEVLDAVADRSGLIVRRYEEHHSAVAYCFHPILREHLRGMLLSTDLPAAQSSHARAAWWFLDHGPRIDAVGHAARCGDQAVLDTVLASVGPEMINTGDSEVLLAVLRRAGRRPSRLGSWGRTIAAAALLECGHPAQAAVSLAISTPLAASDARLRVARESLQIHLDRRLGLPWDAGALTSAVPTGDPELRLQIAAQRGSALLWAGAVDAAEHELNLALDLARGLNRDAALIDVLAFLGGVATARSNVGAVDTAVREALELIESNGWAGTARSAYVHLLAAGVAWQRFDDDAVSRHVARACASGSALEAAADPSVRVSLEIMRHAASFEARPRGETAARLHETWAAKSAQAAAPDVLAHGALLDARASLAVHRPRWAHEVAEQIEAALGRCAEQLVVLALIEETGGRRAAARSLLAEAISGGVRTVVPATEVDARALAARLALRDDDRYAATQALRPALERTARLGTLRTLRVAGGEEVASMLRADRGRWDAQEGLVERLLHADGAAHQLSRVLTAREADVLRELPTLRTVAEISGSLHLSSNTVKTHLRAVYHKLGVSSRRAAVEAARGAGLL